MRHLQILVFFFIVSKAYNQCKCASDSDMENRISCEVTHFRNHTKLYWQYNCDSSWLVFQKRNGQKEILMSFEKEMMDFTERLGYNYVAEYKFTFLVQHNVISGCCAPPEFILFDKQTGVCQRNLGPLVFYSEDPKYPYVVFFNGNQYANNEKSDYNSLIILNIDSNKVYRKSLPKNRISKTLEFSRDSSAELLFDEPSLKGNILTLPYRYKTSLSEDSWLDGKVSIVLK
jgi:hypothetical protein